MSQRILKINDLISQQLAIIINEELEFPLGTIVTITRVKTSSDLKSARVYVSVIPEDNREKVMRVLIGEAKDLQTSLNDRVVLRNIPKLKFYIDDTETGAQKIDEVLDNLKY